MAVSTFPQIVRFLETVDAPGSACPHCGATGRWITRFQVADGRTLGAMRGCLKLFPVSRVATEQKALLDRLDRYEKSGWGVPRKAQIALDACEAFFAGTATEAFALTALLNARPAKPGR